jgi:GntR family transcriptional regulator
MVIEIDLNSKIPIYKQIEDQIIGLIAKGELKAGDKLPSVRNLADICGINPMTANKAYKILEENGYITINRRSGALVREKEEANAKDIKDLKLVLQKLYASGMTRQEIKNTVEKYLEEIC